jgi:hypothetical protein
MTMRERMHAVLAGREHDRVPFCTYSGMEGLPFDEITAVLGPNRWGRLHFTMVHRVSYPHCRFETEDQSGSGSHLVDVAHEAIGLRFPSPPPAEGERWQRNTIHTPAGSIYEERVFEPEYESSTARKHFLRTPADYEVFWAFLGDAVIEPHYDRYLQEDALAGDDGMAMAWIERTPYQQLWVEWVGLGNLGIHMADFPDYVHRTMDLLRARLRTTFEIAARSPAPFVEMPDNITAPAIGPRRFREYCVPLYNELAAMLADRGALVFVHMDGELQGLWDEIAASSVGGLDSFTPAPDTATPIEQAVACCPDLRLWVNFPASRHLSSPEDVRATADAILEAAGHTGRLQLQITENIAAGTWPTSLPIIADAIEEFGRP